METTNNNVLKPTGKTKNLKSTKDQERQLSANIMFALEIKQAFEMYSYRIISPEDFIDRITDLIDFQKQNK